jgi:hypothetical protein
LLSRPVNAHGTGQQQGVLRRSVRGAGVGFSTSRRPRGRMILPIAIGVAVLLFVAILLRWFGVPIPTGRVSDSGHRVTLTLPWGWIDATDRRRAGQMSTDDGSGGETAVPWRVPDIQVERFLGPLQDVEYARVHILNDQPGLGLTVAHERHIAAVCDLYNCGSVGPITEVSLDGRPALQQSIHLPADDFIRLPPGLVVLITTRVGNSTIQLAAFNTNSDALADGGTGARIIASAKIRTRS